MENRTFVGGENQERLRAQSHWWNERGYPLGEIDPGRWIGGLATRKGSYRSVFASGLDAHGRWHRG